MPRRFARLDDGNAESELSTASTRHVDAEVELSTTEALAETEMSTTTVQHIVTASPVTQAKMAAHQETVLRS